MRTPALKAYINRVGATQKSFRKFVVEGEPAYGKMRHALATIKIDGDKIICDNKEHAPSADEAKSIAAELQAITFPTSISFTSNQIAQLAAQLGDHPTLFKFCNRTGGTFSFVQQRTYLKGGGKNDLPWTFWSDGQWRQMEPDGGLLPLYGLDQLSKGRPVMIHEGAKTAAYLQRLTDSHPWAEDLKWYVHLGWPGGALRPHGVDWDPIRSLPIHQRVVLVCDRDQVGEEAATKISSKLRRSLMVIRFPHEFPQGFDLADEFPKLSKPLSMDDCMEPATWATQPVETGGKPAFKLNAQFVDEWLFSDDPAVYVHKDQRNRLRSAETFNRIVGTFSDIRDTAALLNKHLSSKCGGITYVPTRMTNNKMPPITIIKNGERLINTYLPSIIVPIDGDERPWLDYLVNMIPDAGDRAKLSKLIATWIATDVRTSYGVLLISEAQGVGKSTLAHVLTKLLGDRNSRTVTEGDISSAFNGWMAHTRLVIAHEIYAGHSRAIYNKLKAVITETFTRINEKYLQPYSIDICCHVIACSNSTKALSLDDTDRRWLVPRVTDQKQSDAYWKSFYDWISADGLGIIAHWAERYVVEHGAVRPGEHSPWTTMKQEVVEAGMSDGQILAYDLAKQVAELPEKIILSVTDVRGWVASWRELNVNDHRMEQTHTIRRALRAGGLQNPELRDGRTPRFKIHKTLSQVVANFRIDSGMKWEDLGSSYMKMEDVMKLLHQEGQAPVSSIHFAPPI
jgi:hypothetical protein